MKARTLAIIGSMLICTVGAGALAYYAYFALAYLIDSCSYLPLVEGSIPPVFWEPRITEGQILGGTVAGVIIMSFLALDGVLIWRSRRA